MQAFELYWVERFFLTQGLRCSAQGFAGFELYWVERFFEAGFELYWVECFYNPLATLRMPNFKLFTLKFIRRPSLHFDNFR